MGGVLSVVWLCCRDELREAAAVFREKDEEQHREVDALEEELDELRKAHAR